MEGAGAGAAVGERASLCQPSSRCPSPSPGSSACSRSSSTRCLGAVGPWGHPASPPSSAGFATGAGMQMPVPGGFFRTDRGRFGGAMGSGAVPWHPGEAGLTLAGAHRRRCCWVRGPRHRAGWGVTVTPSQTAQQLPLGDWVPQMLNIFLGPACSSMKYFHCSSNSKHCRERGWC